jgi:hypothetical protein
MGNQKSNRFNSDIISASEIGQFYFCSIAWYLKKCGYEPNSSDLYTGDKKHVTYGKIIDYSNSKLKKSKMFVITSIVFLAISFLILLLKVIT